MNKKTVTLCAGLIFCVLVVCFATADSIASTEIPFEKSETEKTLAELSVRLASFETKSGDFSRAENTAAEMRNVAKERFRLLTNLIEKNPGEILRFALPAEVLAKMPDELADSLEKRVEIKGELEIISECEETDARILYFLKTETRRLQLHFGKQPQKELLTGSKIEVEGVMMGDRLIVEETQPDDTGGLQITEAALPNTFGEQKLLVLLVNFQDDQSQPATIDQVNNLIFNSANASSVTNFYRENSYQQTWITGDVKGYFTLPMSSGDCGGSQISYHAKRAAQNAGINLSAYHKFMYFFPTMPACSYAGKGTIGGSETWINGYLLLGTISHELGHNFGLYHSRAMECGTTVLGSNCSTIEYGSNVDTMGKAGVTGHFQPFHKERLGWLDNGSSPPETIVQISGDYVIAPYSLNDLGTKALKILKSTDASGVKTWYHIEFRRPFGFDRIISANSNLMNGVMISLNKETNGQENYLLDMTPETVSWDDPALVVGRSYTDSTAEITIAPISLDNNGATVRVTFGAAPSPTPTPTPTVTPTPTPSLTPTPTPTPTPAQTPSPTPTPTPSCYQANPSVAVSPGGTQWLTPGATASYTVTVINNNTGTCSNATFNLQSTLPSGWTASAAAPVLNVASGASVTTSVQIASPAAAADGFYNLEIRAANAAVPALFGATTVNCAIYSSLGVSAAPSQSSYTKTQTAVVTSEITANGAPMAGATVTFTMTKANGSIVKNTATSAADGKVTFSYRFSKKNDPTGRYVVTATANLSGVGGNASTSFEVR